MENTLDKPKAQDLRTTRDSNRAREMARKSIESGNRRPRGLSKTTITREEAYRKVQERIIERSMKLANAQTMLGLGTIKVFRIDAHYEYFGKQKKLVKDKPKIVKNDDEIINVLDHEYGDGDSPDEISSDYPKFYFVEIKDANNQAIDSQFNRLFGKPKETVDVTSNGQSIAPVIVGMRIIDNSVRNAEVVEPQSIKILDSEQSKLQSSNQNETEGAPAGNN